MKKGTKKQAKKQGKQGKKGKGGKASKAKKPAKKEAKPAGKKKAKASGKKKGGAPPPDLDALRKPVEKAKAALTAAEVEAQTIEGQAKEIRTKAKDAFRDALAPYREACRKAGVDCEFGGTRAPNVSERISFLVEKTGKGVRIMVKGKPETEEVIPFKVLEESIPKAALAYTEKHCGPKEIVGNKAGSVQNRLRAALVGK